MIKLILNKLTIQLIRWIFIGLLMNLLASPSTKQIPGLLWHKYLRDLFNCLKIVSWTGSSLPTPSILIIVSVDVTSQLKFLQYFNTILHLMHN